MAILQILESHEERIERLYFGNLHLDWNLGISRREN